jgi:tryptophan synthase alpha chain
MSATNATKNRLVERMAARRARGDKALVAYLTAGDPSLEETVDLVVEAARAGADVIELGMPWSDPSADGPVIQRAMERALSTGGAGGGTVDKTLEVARRVRAASDVPIVLFGYFNPLFVYGEERLARAAREAGVDGVLVVDLPPEEAGSFDAALAAEGLVRVPLLAPTTSPERARAIVAPAGGFAYYVALTGVTGAGHLDVADVARRVEALRPSLGALPLAVGFGIKDGASAAQVGAVADAIVVGSALVRAIEEAPDAPSRRRAVGTLVSEIKRALTGVRGYC